jgi:GT2 family glycosyltransferase/tetratricopeptide (TPR) repeat protein
MSITKVAIIFDNKIRPDTTGVYCRRALGQLLEIEHFLPTELSRIPRDVFDAYIQIDDGLEYRLPRDVHPCAWWAIDTHLNLDWYLKKGPDFDLIYTAQRDGASQLRQAGMASAGWLPLACDPEIHRKHEVPKSIDVCFVAHLFPGPRQDLLDLIQRRFRNTFVGQRFLDEMAKTYSESRIVFNRSLRNDVNMREFEALSCGSLLVTNDLKDNGQAELFQDGVHLATYSDAGDLLDKIEFYLRRADLRERIAAAGREEALSRHTYVHRMAQIIHDLDRLETSVAVPATPTDFGLTSIIIVTHNQLAYTQRCVESIKCYTDEPFELIFVDNASHDGTQAYLGRLKGAQVIVNTENRGFPAAVNQGLDVAKGRQVLLLNNDTIVTTSWLRRLLTALHSDPKIGLVGPCSNYVASAQQIEVPYKDLSYLDGFAWDWGNAHEGERVVTDRLIGFCLLIRRELIDAIGLFDERFGIGCFEDDDYCRRALQAGFRSVIARDGFVHHFGSRTFMAAGIDFSALMEHNRKVFEEKWAAVPDPAPTPDWVTESDEPATLSLKIAKTRCEGIHLERTESELSLCMIARDNADTIGAAVASAKPWVDEMIVVDTGSKDATSRIARQLGARVEHFPWCDDFSAARNESLKYAHGRWIFWMDSDDTIDAANGRQLRQLMRHARGSRILGFVAQVHCPGAGPEGDADVTVVDHVKLFRNLPDMRFEGRIHEQILPAIRRLAGDVAWSDVFVVHSGYDHSPAGQEKKKERDLKLLHREEQERPNHPFTLFNLGMTYNDIAEHAKAIDYLKRSIENSGAGETHLPKAYSLLVYALGQTGDRQSAWATCERGLELFPEDLELRFRRALLLHEMGCLDESATAYESVLNHQGERHFSSLDRGIRSFKARQNLAVVYTDMGQFAKAEEQWRLILDEVPEYRAGWRGLGDILLRQNKLREAATLSQRLVKHRGLRLNGILLQAELCLRHGDLLSARTEFQRTVREYPEDIEAWQTLGRFLFEHGDPHETESALHSLLRLDPKDGASHHNLGTVYLQTGRYEEAIESYRQALKYRPKAAHTHLYLGHALKHAGRRAEAAAAYSDCLRIDPENETARNGLQECTVGFTPRPRR